MKIDFLLLRCFLKRCDFTLDVPLAGDWQRDLESWTWSGLDSFFFNDIVNTLPLSLMFISPVEALCFCAVACSCSLSFETKYNNFHIIKQSLVNQCVNAVNVIPYKKRILTRNSFCGFWKMMDVRINKIYIFVCVDVDKKWRL